MLAHSKTGLFGVLPEHVSAQRPRGASQQCKAERRQVSLGPVSPVDLLPYDDRVRFVWVFAERLDLSALQGAIKAVEAILVIPRPTLPCCWRSALYATVGDMGNARELGRLCREHAGFELLRGGVGMNHTMLAEFRVVHGAVLEPLLADSFAATLRTGQGLLDGLFKTARY